MLPLQPTECFSILFDPMRSVELFQTAGKCSMYGECMAGPTGNLNCEYNGPPRPMNDSEGLDILRTYCPNLVTSKRHVTCSPYMQKLA